LVLVQALHDLMSAHQRFILQEQLGHLAELDERITRLDEKIEERLRPFEADLVRLRTIPGIGSRPATILRRASANMDALDMATAIAVQP